MEGIENAQEECFDQVASSAEELAEKSWIFILPHSNIDKQFFQTWVDDFNIRALIIVSDAPIDSSSIFLKPSIISVISEKEATKINSLNTVMQAEGIFLNVRVEHEYETNCTSDI